MAYMVEGEGSNTLSKAKAWLYKFRDQSHTLLAAITDVCVQYFVGQVEAGAQLLQLFESDAGLLGPHQFAEFSLPYIRRISEQVKEGLKQKGLPAVPMVGSNWECNRGYINFLFVIPLMMTCSTCFPPTTR